MTLEMVNLKFRIGDTWSSPIWAILVDDSAIDLTLGHWTVTAQARRDWDTPVLQEWSSLNGRVLFGEVDVAYDEDDNPITTSTIQLMHTAADSENWEPFSANFEVQIQRGNCDNIERHTVVAGRITATRDITR